MRIDLTDKTALVTGSTQGIGLAIARGLAAAGAKVGINGRSETSVSAAIDELRTDLPDTDLVADIDDRRGDQHVGDERDHEDAVGEVTLQVRPEGSEERIHGGHDGNRQVRLQHQGHGRLQEESQHDAGQQAENGDQNAAFLA